MSDRRPLRVYIAGTMTGGTGRFFNMEKINEAIECYFTLIELGYVPTCPHLSVFCEFMQPHRIKYEQWLTLDFHYIDDCDCVLRIPGDSAGADRECKYALSLGKPVYWGIGEFVLHAGKEEPCPVS